jgi:gas vesicle protein
MLDRFKGAYAMNYSSFLIAAALSVALSSTACSKREDHSVDKAVESTKEAARDTGEAIKETGRDIKSDAKEAGREIKGEVKETAADVKEAAHDPQ